MSPRYLEVWKAIEPPADFADRVADRARRSERQRLTRRTALAFAAAACTALAAWKLDRKPDQSGDVTAVVRTEVELAPGAVAILEQGARLLWDRAGARQLQGDVSYRLLPGVALQVETALGNLRALGASCRVKMAETAGRAVAVFVSVTRGDVDVVSIARSVALCAGHYARVTSIAVDTDADDVSGDIALALDLPTPTNRSLSPPPASPQEMTVAPAPKRPPDRASRALPQQAPAVDAGARTVIVPSCFCDRGDSLCACFH
jgi:hypothetical protein